MKKNEKSLAPAKPFAEMTPEEQVAYVKGLEEKAAGLEDENSSLKKTTESQSKKLKEAKVDEVDTSFQVGKKKYDFVGKKIHINGETLDVRDLVSEGTEEAEAKFQEICAQLVKSNSGIIKEI